MGPKLKNLKKISQKEERSAKYINQRKKDSYLADDNNFEQFTKQLAKIGLELRDTTGDGNCLFRALSDQIEGNEGNHLLYRKQVCEYMRKNRVDFEPFVVGLVEEIEHRKRGGAGNIDKNLEPFERYINYLEQTGTYGGNDCLVAFSRLQEVDIFLHQIDQPVWKVNGAFFNSKNIIQIHLAYHNGEHYSSIRKIGDLSNTPANIRINTVNEVQNVNNENQNKNKNNKKSNYNATASYNYDEDYLDDDDSALANKINELNLDNTNEISDEALDNIMNITNCFDVNLIKEIYNENNCNLDLTISNLLAISSTNVNNNEDENKVDESKRKKFKNLKPREKKQLKKQKQMERQQNKILEEQENNRSKNFKIKNSNENACGNVCNDDQENNNVINLPTSIEAKSI